MKKYIVYISGFVIIISLIIAIVFLLISKKDNKSTHKTIENNIDTYFYENKITEQTINLSDFTPFEWDRCLVYGYPNSPQEISRALNVNLDDLYRDTSFDLSGGIIFMNGVNIQYIETFWGVFPDNGEDTFEVNYKTQDNENDTLSYRIFEKAEAVFDVITFTRDEYKNKRYYRLYPTN